MEITTTEVPAQAGGQSTTDRASRSVAVSRRHHIPADGSGVSNGLR